MPRASTASSRCSRARAAWHRRSARVRSRRRIRPRPPGMWTARRRRTQLPRVRPLRPLALPAAAPRAASSRLAVPPARSQTRTTASRRTRARLASSRAPRPPCGRQRRRCLMTSAPAHPARPATRAKLSQLRSRPQLRARLTMRSSMMRAWHTRRRLTGTQTARPPRRAVVAAGCVACLARAPPPRGPPLARSRRPCELKCRVAECTHLLHSRASGSVVSLSPLWECAPSSLRNVSATHSRSAPARSGPS
mmetsp:Transcript_14496/g.45314  ORF Transcript_14496/g.45314 Transcript_14496/m.45314 type:complete len:250 (+) Transcript_14496:497-1246(+)